MSLINDKLLKCDNCFKEQVIDHEFRQPIIPVIPDKWFRLGGWQAGKHFCPECYKKFMEMRKQNKST